MRPIWILAASALLAGTLTGCAASKAPTGGPSPSGAALGAGPAASGSPSPSAVPSRTSSTAIDPCALVTQSEASALEAVVVPYQTTSTRPALPASSQGKTLVW